MKAVKEIRITKKEKYRSENTVRCRKEKDEQGKNKNIKKEKNESLSKKQKKQAKKGGGVDYDTFTEITL